MEEPKDVMAEFASQIAELEDIITGAKKVLYNLEKYTYMPEVDGLKWAWLKADIKLRLLYKARRAWNPEVGQSDTEGAVTSTGVSRAMDAARSSKKVKIPRPDEIDDKWTEPDPLNGYTIYWDRNRRMQELRCQCMDIEPDEQGRYDMEELQRRLDAISEEEFWSRWEKFMIRCVEETANRYKMPDKWLTILKRHIATLPRPDGVKEPFLKKFLKWWPF